MEKEGNLRKKNFKKGIDSDDARRRREETTIQIRYERALILTRGPFFYDFGFIGRKSKKEERLNQRRKTVSKFAR
jgi:hypothetical protein